MSEKQEFEMELAKLPELHQYLVRECAHQVQQVLARYQDPLISGLAVALVAGELQESIKY